MFITAVIPPKITRRSAVSIPARTRGPLLWAAMMAAEKNTKEASRYPLIASYTLPSLESCLLYLATLPSTLSRISQIKNISQLTSIPVFE